MPVVDAKYLDELFQLDQQFKILKDEHDVLKATLFSTISKFRTVERLVESWPEVSQLLPTINTLTVGTGVAISAKDLNALCGLPKP